MLLRRRTVLTKNPDRYSLSFDGVFGWVAFYAFIPPAGDFTLLTWAKPEAVADGTECIICIQYIFGATDPTLYWYSTTSFGAASNQHGIRIADDIKLIGSDLRGNGWVFLGVTRENDDWTLYENCSVVDSASASGTIADSTSTLGYSSSYNTYNGLLDDFYCYNKALSQSEMQKIYYNSGKILSDLIAHYGFDEGSGRTVRDLSGNGHTGTIHGDATYSVEKPG